MLSVLALVAPAAGIAYLGAVSYRDEKGAVSAQQERQRQAALAIAGRIDRSIGDALDAVDRTIDSGGTSVDAPLARFWFWIDADGQLRRPRIVPPIDPAVSLERGNACAGGLEECVRELTTLHQVVMQQAYMMATGDMFWMASMTCLVLAAMMWLTRPRRGAAASFGH